MSKLSKTQRFDWGTCYNKKTKVAAVGKNKTRGERRRVPTFVRFKPKYLTELLHYFCLFILSSFLKDFFKKSK